MDRRIPRIAALLILVALIAGVVLSLRDRPSPVVEAPTPQPSAQPSPQPSPQPSVEPSPVPPRPHLPYTPVPEGTISPIVVERIPARGAELRPDGAVELVFDRPMDQASVAAAFSLSPAVPGAIEWADARTLRFRPAQALPRAAVYDVALSQGARAQDGAPLNGAYQFRFATTGFLEVGQVIPADGAQDVQAGSTITVLFSRPVVPLRVVEQQGNAPQPLTFEPAVAGTGEWLSTAVYVFHPSASLPGGTAYTGHVAAGLKDVDGNPLQSEFTWHFTTARPQVVFTFPEDKATLVSAEPQIQIQFNQPIDSATAPAAFHLRAGGADVAGALQVVNETLIFTPAQRLQFDKGYQIEVAAGLGSRGGGVGMAADYHSSFHTVPLPRILKTTPANGDQHANPYTDFAIYFNAPIDTDTVMANIQMTPPLSPTQVYTYFDTFNNIFHLSFGAKPSSDYSVHIGPSIADPYGNTTGQTLDVRFRTDQLPPSAQLITSNFVATYNAQNPTRVGLSSVNTSSASLNLYRLQTDDLKQPYQDWNARVAALTPLRSWQAQLDAPLDKTTLSRIDLVEGGGRLDPGVYLLMLDQPQGPPQPHMLVVSALNLTLKAGERDALVWASDLQSGQPVPSLALDFFDDQGAALGTAKTDSDGVAQLHLDRTENRGVLAVSSQPFAAVASGWSAGVGPWEFGLPTAGDLPEMTAHIYTDRPIYRPGQTVDFKGVLRAEDDVRFSLPASLSNVGVTIRSVTGEQLYQQNLPLSPNGTFDGSLKLAEGAALGPYSIEVMAGQRAFNVTFQVAAYRPPEFQVTVTPQSKEIVRGTGTSATAEVSYFFGGPVANVPVQWNVLAETYRFAPEWAGRYQFSNSDDPWRCWDCWWLPNVPPQPILSGSGTTDAQGRLRIDIPAALKDTQGVPITDSVKLTIEATATGKDNQAISGRSDLIVHSGQLYIGLAAQTYVGRAGEEQKIDLVTADTQRQRLPNQALEVETFRYTWENKFIQEANGGHWEWKEQRTSVDRQSISTDGQAQATMVFTPTEGGSYRVVASASDSGGNTVRSSLFVWVAGNGYMSWRRENNDRITLISDKTEYKVGETATILIPSPFTQPHWALITVERGGVLSHEVRRVQGNSIVYQLPLTAAHAPNVFVSAVLFSPPEAPGRPADYKVGILPLAVAPDPQSLRVTLTPSQPQAEPGQPVSYGVQVTDLGGQPVAAELSLDLVDKAVLSLLPRTPDAIREAFYSQRGLGIVTASGMSVSAERLMEQFDQELERQERERASHSGTINDGLPRASGGGAAPEPTASPAAEAAPAAPAQADQSAAYAGPPLTIREQFADTAYWNARVTTDASGRATVEVKLPDNLTTWVMRGVGLTNDTRVGEGTVEVVATKPLLIRPVTPRFFVVGDMAELAANVSNHTGDQLAVQVGLATHGLSVTGELTKTVQVPANGETMVTWPVQVQDVEAADLVFTAISGQYGDASRPRLGTGPDGTVPVYRYSAPEVVGTGGQLEAAGSRTEVIGLPPNVDTRSGELTVRLDPSLAAGMRDGLDYLEHFPYECTEQTVSRFLPNVLTARALKSLGIANPELESRLPGLVEEGLNRLYNQQHPDGGWGWWPDDTSNPHISAYVVFGMLRAKESGFTVREDVLSRGLDYLSSALVVARDLHTTADANRQSWLLYVLAEGGRANSSSMSELYGDREKLATYARAFLAMALQKGGAAADDARLKTLLSDINNAAILSATGAHWEEDQYDPWGMNTDTRSTAITLDALVRLDPQNQLNPNIVRWLMVARKDGIWETTQESAWSLMALTDWMGYTKELQADYDYAAWLNNKEQTSGHIGQADLEKPIVLKIAVSDLLKDTGNRLTIGRGAGGGRLYYTAHLRAFLPVQDIKALDRGVIVRRRYTLASCTDGPKCPEVTQARLGDVLRVELSIVAPHDLYYMVVEDPLPAGAEAVDTDLATTSLLAPGAELQRTPPGPIPSEGGVASEAPIDPFWRWWNWYSRSELRDEKVALFADYLPKGSYLYSYTMRATLPGEFRVIPTTASEMYFPEVYGRGDGQLLRVTR
jgi:alpha-2-macroglobulin